MPDHTNSSVAPIRLDGTQVKFVAGASVSIKSTESRDTAKELRGLDAELISIPPVTGQIKKNGSVSYSEIVVPDNFPPGSVMVFATWVDSLEADLDEFIASDAASAFSGLNLVDLNPVLFRCDGEERDARALLRPRLVLVRLRLTPLLESRRRWRLRCTRTRRSPLLRLPGLDATRAAHHGAQRSWTPARGAPSRGILGARLRSRTLGEVSPPPSALDVWILITYFNDRQVGRLPNLAKPAAWLKERFDKIKADVPAFLRPKYFCMVINIANKAARARAISLTSPVIQEGNDFVAALALTSLQMYGEVQSASLDPFKVVPSLAAGLPHFTTGVRNPNTSHRHQKG